VIRENHQGLRLIVFRPDVQFKLLDRDRVIGSLAETTDQKASDKKTDENDPVDLHGIGCPENILSQVIQMLPAQSPRASGFFQALSRRCRNVPFTDFQKTLQDLKMIPILC